MYYSRPVDRLPKRLIRIFILMALVTLLSSCREENAGQSGTAGTGSSARVSVPGSTSCVRTVQEGLTDLTDAAHKVTGTLCACAFHDETHLMLLSLREKTYMTTLMDVRDGSLTPHMDFPCAEDVSTAGEFMEILSTDPLVIHNTVNGYLYQPQAPMESAQCIRLPAWLLDASFQVLDGQVYFSSDRGIVYALSADGSYEAVWRLPRQFNRLTPVPAAEPGLLSFDTYPVWDDRIKVRVVLDPASGDAVLSQTQMNGSCYAAGADGVLVTTNYRQTPCLTIRDLRAGAQYVLTLPQQAQTMLDEGLCSTGDSGSADPDSMPVDDHTFLSVPPLCLSGSSSCWTICDSTGKPAMLYLWEYRGDPSTQWTVPVTEPCRIPEEISYGALSERAQALGEACGASIVIGENVPEYFDDYQVETVTDERIVDGMLSVLENTLQLLPPNFFENLRGDYYREIVIFLTGAMIPQDAGSSISNAGAFTTQSNGLCILAFNLEEDPALCTVIHELVHAIDYRLAGEELLDEEEWNSMNPEGFSYYGRYISEDGESYETAGDLQYTIAGGGSPDEVWFIDPYSKTFSMEDRARLVEYLMENSDPPDAYLSGVHIREKLTYYFRILREVLSDDSWPEQTSWEKALEESG